MLLTIAEITEKLNKYFDEHEEILFAIIFGSTAKGTANKISDVDIAVMINPNFNKSFPFGYQAELIKHNIIPLEFAENIRGMIGFRNLLVHTAKLILRSFILFFRIDYMILKDLSVISSHFLIGRLRLNLGDNDLLS